MKNKIIFFLLISTFNFVAQETVKGKELIDTNQISYMEIVKVTTSQSVASVTKKVSKKQFVDFAQKWNNSKEQGADKFRMKYFVYLYLKNGTKRQFSIRDAKIQESGWLTFDIGDKTYFDKIWNKIKY